MRAQTLRLTRQLSAHLLHELRSWCWETEGDPNGLRMGRTGYTRSMCLSNLALLSAQTGTRNRLREADDVVVIQKAQVSQPVQSSVTSLRYAHVTDTNDLISLSNEIQREIGVGFLRRAPPNNDDRSDLGS